MDLHYLDNILIEKGLRVPIIEALVPDSKLYEIMFLQLSGVIEANENFIGNRNQKENGGKIYEFLQLSLRSEAALVVTPEYSCPWIILDKIISDNCLPKEHKLWILGCESICKDELKHFMQLHNEITWICEEKQLDKEGVAPRFVDPLLYIFSTTDTLGRPRIVMVIQFKTTHMSVHKSALERDNLITGESVYILRNNESSIYLLSLVCSDSLGFDRTQLKNNQQATLIVHIQMNPKPLSDNFKNYRNDFYSCKDEHKEVFCINWASPSNIADEFPIDYSGSALYIKTKELDRSDQRIEYNHHKGLYFTCWENRKTSNYYFNTMETIFHFRNTKVIQNIGTPEQQKRTGPEMLSTYIWHEDRWVEIDNIDDGFFRLLDILDMNRLADLFHRMNSLDIERLIALSCGEINGKNWYVPESLYFLLVNDTERIMKMTYTHDNDVECQTRRMEYLEKINILYNYVLNDYTNYPINIRDLVNNFSFRYEICNHNCNLYATENKVPPATVVFIGMAPFVLAKRIFDKINYLLDDKSRRRLVVWYENNTVIRSIFNQYPVYDDDLINDPRSIDKEN